MTEIPDLTEEEHAGVVAALRKLIADDKFPLSPRLKPLTSALAKMAPQPPRKPQPPPQPGDGPRYGKGGSARRTAAQPARHRLVRAGRAAAAVAMASLELSLASADFSGL
jgi:hypothetical protein